ncbi:MAG: flagellar biosynthetic protein FliO [Candidatus Acidiferrales bacterium]
MLREAQAHENKSLPDWLLAGWRKLAGFSRGTFLRREPRRLRLCETLSLGNRGYLAVVRFQEQQFLVGGTNASMALLAELSPVRPAAADEVQEEFRLE